ncbi:hypothetical protein [Prosthecomicrobium hirschii]|uniref:hypothetical protein n=1 Tax=Prosthecodimorpha hirschii TaxID=665126 RepID=UPI00221EAD19|nr:hypothetical protein [Prosthecomicrobium hirschii]MCW1839739.1 hypothetical protein [Prosthecomicrobium hirschii]
MADILRSIANSTVKSGFVSSLSFGDMETGKQDSVKISSKSNPISWVVNKLRSGHNKAVKDDFLQALVGTGKFDGPIASKKIEALKSVINYESSKPLDLDQAKLAIKLFNGSVKDLSETEYASLSRTQLHALAYGTAKVGMEKLHADDDTRKGIMQTGFGNPYQVAKDSGLLDVAARYFTLREDVRSEGGQEAVSSKRGFDDIYTFVGAFSDNKDFIDGFILSQVDINAGKSHQEVVAKPENRGNDRVRGDHEPKPEEFDNPVDYGKAMLSGRHDENSPVRQGFEQALKLPMGNLAKIMTTVLDRTDMTKAEKLAVLDDLAESVRSLKKPNVPVKVQDQGDDYGQTRNDTVPHEDFGEIDEDVTIRNHVKN